MTLSATNRKPSADAPQHYPTKDLTTIVSATDFVESIMNAMWSISPHLRPSIKKRMEEGLRDFLCSKLREFWDKSLSEKQLDTLVRESLKNYGGAPNSQLLNILTRIFQSSTTQTSKTKGEIPWKVTSLLG